MTEKTQRFPERHSLTTVRVVDHIGDFLGLRDEWERLAAASSSTVYQSFVWLSRWWKHFAEHPSCSLHILQFFNGKTLIGIAPLFIETTSFAGKEIFRTMKLMGSATQYRSTPCIPQEYGPSDYLDIIAPPEAEAAVAISLLRYLKDHPAVYDRVQLSHVPQDSIVMKRFVPLLRGGEFPYSAEQSEICPRLTVPVSIDDYLAEREPGVRRRLVQARKAFHKDTTYEIESMETRESFEDFFQSLIALHQHRWNSMGYPGLFSNPWFLQFQREVALEFLQSGGLWCKAALAGGAVVAARMAFRYNDCYYDYLSGFDPQSPAAKRRPGLGLLLTMVSDAVDERMSVVDFLRGDESYKFELTNEYVYNWTVTIENRRGRTALRTMPFKTVRLLRQLRHRIAGEFTLLKIQQQQHGTMQAAPHYLAFRVQRVKAHPLGKTIGQLAGKIGRSLVRLSTALGPASFGPAAERASAAPMTDTAAVIQAGRVGRRRNQKLEEVA